MSDPQAVGGQDGTPELGYCAHCGTRFADLAGWPRHCTGCGRISFRNPVPVTIVLLPVFLHPQGADLGLPNTSPPIGIVTVRRAIAPAKGRLALPGGYIDYGETWQEAGAREMREEAGIEISPSTLRPIEVYSASDGTLIIAAIAPTMQQSALPPFVPNQESGERVILVEPEPMAFELHTRLVTRRLSGEPLGYCVRLASS